MKYGFKSRLHHITHYGLFFSLFSHHKYPLDCSIRLANTPYVMISMNYNDRVACSVELDIFHVKSPNNIQRTNIYKKRYADKSSVLSQKVIGYGFRFFV